MALERLAVGAVERCAERRSCAAGDLASSSKSSGRRSLFVDAQAGAAEPVALLPSLVTARWRWERVERRRMRTFGSGGPRRAAWRQRTADRRYDFIRVRRLFTFTPALSVVSSNSFSSLPIGCSLGIDAAAPSRTRRRPSRGRGARPSRSSRRPTRRSGSRRIRRIRQSRGKPRLPFSRRRPQPRRCGRRRRSSRPAQVAAASAATGAATAAPRRAAGRRA